MKLCAALLLSALLVSLSVTAQETLRTFDLSPKGTIHVTTELIVKKFASADFTYSPLQDADTSSITALDVSKAKKMLGYEATTPLSDILDEVIPWIAEQVEIGQM